MQLDDDDDVFNSSMSKQKTRERKITPKEEWARLPRYMGLSRPRVENETRMRLGSIRSYNLLLLLLLLRLICYQLSEGLYPYESNS
jgi:hypothetical protein